MSQATTIQKNRKYYRRPIPSQQELKRLFEYDPETGLLFNKIYRGSKAQKGHVAGGKNDDGYIVVGINGIYYKAHRLITQLYYGAFDPLMEIDHINSIRDDNRLCNLRLVTQNQNMKSKKLYKNNTSGVIGVYFSKPLKKWAASIRSDGHHHFLGYYNDIKDAIEKRKEAEKMFGFFAEHGSR